MQFPTSPLERNRLLACLPAAEVDRLVPHMHPMLLHHGEVLCEIHHGSDWVYFPKAGAISIMLISQGGVEVEVGLVGAEGAIGAPEALSRSQSLGRFVVQVPGSGWRITSQMFREQYQQLPAFRERIWLHQHTLLAIAAQSALCNRLHSLESRLSRWLLTIHDRNGGEDLQLTQEFIGSMLGTRRVGVTEAIGVLRNAKLIETHRGCVTILDREGMEKTACECYQITRNWSDRM
ncbi:MAG: Crp/Fnr family transcriptional regulator [Armatimonadetes bacterium]|nr:Crp/Fnr family transcriptional regulator [Armatimonadota bacterium]